MSVVGDTAGSSRQSFLQETVGVWGGQVDMPTDPALNSIPLRFISQGSCAVCTLQPKPKIVPSSRRWAGWLWESVVSVGVSGMRAGRRQAWTL